MSNTFDEIQKRENALLCNTYGRYPLAVSKAKDCTLFDLDGDEYLDFLAGIAVCSLGHSRDDIADVMAEQARKMVHVSNLFYQEPQLDLAEKLLSTCAAGKVFSATPAQRPMREPSSWPADTCAKFAMKIVTKSLPLKGRFMAGHFPH